ncbi:MAG TPA: haloacid dehalogenase type II [Candidatus Binatia bacterium]|nr:haloacid dehalogenase type II [Candidatus Binatia bacterium]
MTKLKLQGIEACVFDAFGTLFDVNSAAHRAEDSVGEKWPQLAELWREKQLQYTWLRSLSGRYKDFFQVTNDALDFALGALHLNDPMLRARLMNLYLALSTYPEVPDVLQKLRGAGMKTAILSNGNPTMLHSMTDNAGIILLFDAILSVDEVKVYKPHPRAYNLACDRLKLKPEQICFLSSNGWDAYSAKAFGFRVLWCNRFQQEPERLPETPDSEISSLTELLEILSDQWTPQLRLASDK